MPGAVTTAVAVGMGSACSGGWGRLCCSFMTVMMTSMSAWAGVASAAVFLLWL